jgi:hypothetical protein
MVLATPDTVTTTVWLNPRAPEGPALEPEAETTVVTPEITVVATEALGVGLEVTMVLTAPETVTTVVYCCPMVVLAPPALEVASRTLVVPVPGLAAVPGTPSQRETTTLSMSVLCELLDDVWVSTSL